VSDDGHVLGAVAFPQAGLVVVEVDVENPMEAVLDAPMGAHGLARLRGGQDGGGDVKARFEARAVGEFGARLDANEGSWHGFPEILR